MSFSERLERILAEMNRREFLKRTGAAAAAASTGDLGKLAATGASGTAPAVPSLVLLLGTETRGCYGPLERAMEQVIHTYDRIKMMFPDSVVKGGSDDDYGFMVQVSARDVERLRQEGFEVEQLSGPDSYKQEYKRAVAALNQAVSAGADHEHLTALNRLVQSSKQQLDQTPPTELWLSDDSFDEPFEFMVSNDRGILELFQDAEVVTDPVKAWWSSYGKYSDSWTKIREVLDVIQEKDLEPPDGMGSWENALENDAQRDDEDWNADFEEEEGEEPERYDVPVDYQYAEPMHQPVEGLIRYLRTIT